MQLRAGGSGGEGSVIVPPPPAPENSTALAGRPPLLSTSSALPPFSTSSPFNMYKSCLLLVALACLAALTTADKKAAAPDSCAEMTLQTESPVKKDRSPFVIHIDKLRLKAGEATDVVISGKNGETFKKFLLQSRVGRTPKGQFTPNKDAKTIDCGAGKQNGVIQASDADKKSVTVSWTAPKDLKEQVIFYLTIEDSQGNYWVQQKSRTLNVAP